jgi:DUF4097 and DUF4098 domain-containing protein YvlB
VTSNPSVDVRLTAGRVMVRADADEPGVSVASVRAKLASDSRAVSAAASVSITHDGDHVAVRVPEPPGRGRAPQVLVEIVVAPGTDVTCEAGEAELVCAGRVGSLTARSSSGSVHADEVAGPLDLRTGRGPVTVHQCLAGGQVAVADATLIIRAVEGPINILGRSGDVHVWWLAAPANVSTSTGNVRVGWASGRPARLALTSGTGRVEAGVRDDPGAADVLTVSTISGDIRVTQAQRR